MKRLLAVLLTLVMIFPNCYIYAETTVITVGQGKDYSTINEAIAAAPAGTEQEPVIILIDAGSYNENVRVSKPWITLKAASGKNDVTIRYNLKSAVIGNMAGSATVFIEGSATGFRAENITFQNYAYTPDDPDSTPDQYGPDGAVGVALAIAVNADKCVFVGCSFKSFQDTLYTATPKEGQVARQFFKDCYVEGTVDFVFGSGTSWFENCEIKQLRKRGGYYTAANTSDYVPYGLIFNNCRFTAAEGVEAGSTSLGRPWHAFDERYERSSATMIMNSKIGPHVNPNGWSEWNFPEGVTIEEIKKNVRYGEYNNADLDGVPLNTSSRQPWSTVYDAYGAMEFNPYTVLSATDGWNPEGIADGYKEAIEGALAYANVWAPTPSSVEEIGGIKKIIANIDLPGEYNGYSIKWVSSDNTIIKDSISGNPGVVYRPLNGEGDASVTLKAYLMDSEGRGSVVTFGPFIVKEQLDNSQDPVLQSLISTLRTQMDNIFGMPLIKNLKLPMSGTATVEGQEVDYTVSWLTTHPNINIEEYIAYVTRPEEGGDVPVGTITAVVSYNNAGEIKSASYTWSNIMVSPIKYYKATSTLPMRDDFNDPYWRLYRTDETVNTGYDYSKSYYDTLAATGTGVGTPGSNIYPPKTEDMDYTYSSMVGWLAQSGANDTSSTASPYAIAGAFNYKFGNGYAALAPFVYNDNGVPKSKGYLVNLVKNQTRGRFAPQTPWSDSLSAEIEFEFDAAGTDKSGFAFSLFESSDNGKGISVKFDTSHLSKVGMEGNDNQVEIPSVAVYLGDNGTKNTGSLDNATLTGLYTDTLYKLRIISINTDNAANNKTVVYLHKMVDGNYDAGEKILEATGIAKKSGGFGLGTDGSGAYPKVHSVQVSVPPLMPTNFRFGSIPVEGADTVELKWDAVPGADGYRVFIKELDAFGNGSFVEYKDIMNGEMTSTSITDLPEGPQIEFAIAALKASTNPVNGLTVLTESIRTEAIPRKGKMETKVDSPTNIVATRGLNHVVLSWNGVSDEKLSGYKVYYTDSEAKAVAGAWTELLTLDSQPNMDVSVKIEPTSASIIKGGSNITPYVDSVELPSGKRYWFCVASLAATKELEQNRISVYSSYDNAYMLDKIPTGLTEQLPAIDEFDDPDWTILETAGKNVWTGPTNYTSNMKKASDGDYIYEATHGDTRMIWEPYSTANWTDYEVELKFQIGNVIYSDRASMNGLYLLGRTNGINNSYSVGIRYLKVDNQIVEEYAISKNQPWNGSSSDLVSAVANGTDLPSLPVNDEEDEWHLLKMSIKTIGTDKVQISMYLDNKLILSHTDESNVYTSGGVGIAAGRNLEGQKYDYIKVTPIDNRPSVISHHYNTDTLRSGEIISSTVLLGNINESNKKVKHILVLYDRNNRVVAMDVATLDSEVNDTGELVASITLPTGDLTSYKLKAFLWEDLSSMLPVTTIAEFPARLTK